MVKIPHADRIAAETIILGKNNFPSAEFTGFSSLAKDFAEVPDVAAKLADVYTTVVSVRRGDIRKAKDLQDVPQLAAFKEQFDKAGAKPGDYHFEVGGDGKNFRESAVAVTVKGDVLRQAQSNLRGARSPA